jgi:hypothetical protein
MLLPDVVQRYGMPVAKARIDRFYEQPEEARQLMHGDSLIIAVWETEMDESSLSSAEYFPRRAYKCPPLFRSSWKPYSEGEIVPLDITQQDRYLRTEGIGWSGQGAGVQIIFPSCIAVKNEEPGSRRLYIHPSSVARKMARNLLSGKDGTLPDKARADAILSTYSLTLGWSAGLSDLLLVEADPVALGMFMEHWASEEGREAHIRALVAAYILNTSKEPHWERRLELLQRTIGQGKKLGVVGSSVDEEARGLAKEIDARRRQYAESISGKLLGYSDLPASAFRSSALGYPNAAYACGDILLNGKKGYPRDTAAAARYFKFAASLHMPAAAHNLATCYRDGIGLSQDRAKAFFWYRQAAILGFPQSQLNVALCYLNGDGTKRDEVEALAWLKLWGESGMAAPDSDGAKAIQEKVSAISPDTAGRVDKRLAELKVEAEKTWADRADDKAWDVIVEP